VSALLFPRKHARHAKPATAPKVLLAGGLAAAFAVTDAALVAGSASAAAPNSAWERLAECESRGNWSINTGNGYYGGLQFNLGTWRGLGFDGYPHQASKSTQIAAANKLHSQRGFGPWPACSRKLGLRGGGGGGTVAAAQPAPRVAAPAPSARRAAASRAASRSRTAAAVAPRFDGHVMSVADRSRFRAATLQWQRQMRARGWKIGVDGYFGPQSAGIAKRFAAQKGLRATPGTVNAAVFAAAWTAPVT
jgi:hypothetical protein